MTIEQAAEAAVTVFDRDTAITMVAIAGGESGYRPGARGDHLDIFPPAEREQKEPYACNSYTSIGLWQIHMPAHHVLLWELTASDDPCEWQGYLVDPYHNAAVARQVYDSQGFAAWTVYNTGAYEDYLEEATTAVDAAIGIEVPPPVPPPPPLPPPWLPFPTASFLRLRPVHPPPSHSAFLWLPPVHPPPR